MSDHGRYRIGIDVGGTFTDFVMAETQGARLIVHKEASVPDDAARPTARGVTALTFDMGRTRSDVSQVIGGLPEIAQNSMVGDYPLMLPVVGVSAVGGRRSAVGADVFTRRCIGPDPAFALRPPWGGAQTSTVAPAASDRETPSNAETPLSTSSIATG